MTSRLTQIRALLRALMSILVLAAVGAAGFAVWTLGAYCVAYATMCRDRVSLSNDCIRFTIWQLLATVALLSIVLAATRAGIQAGSSIPWGGRTHADSVPSRNYATRANATETDPQPLVDRPRWYEQDFSRVGTANQAR